MKLNNTILGIIFFVLLGLFIARKTIFQPTQRSFKQELTAYDSANIDKVTVQVAGATTTILEKKGDIWQASNGQQTVTAKTSSVDNLIKELSNLKTKQLVSRNPEKWTTYEVDDSKGKIINLYANNKKVAGLHIGRFNFNQQTRSGVSYARLSDEDEIYAIDGFVSMSAAKDFNSFRETKLLTFDLNNIQTVEINADGQSQSLSKSIDGQWVKNQTAIDSTTASRYLTTLSNLNGREFNDIFNPSTAQKIKTLSIGQGTVEAYQDTDGRFILKSNENPAYFKSDSTGIFKQVFLDFDAL